jgi:hypothetical protein
VSCVVSVVVVPVVELVLPFASVVVVVVVLVVPVSLGAGIALLDWVSVSRTLWLQPAATSASVSAAAIGASFLVLFMCFSWIVGGRRRRPRAMDQLRLEPPGRFVVVEVELPPLPPVLLPVVPRDDADCPDVDCVDVDCPEADCVEPVRSDCPLDEAPADVLPEPLLALP